MSSLENALDSLLVRAREDRASRPEFYKQLLASKLLAVGELGEGDNAGKLTLAIGQRDSQQVHLIFSSHARLLAFESKGLAHVIVPARQLFEATLGMHFALNPGWEFGKLLAPEEIAYWLKATAVPEPSRRQPILRVTEPNPYPTTLVKALSVLFISRQVRAAHLLQAEFEGVAPRLLIGVETDADWRKLSMEIAIAVEVASPKLPVDVLRIERDKPKAPVIDALLSVAPFYTRAVFNE